MSQPKDYRVTVKVRNARLINALAEKGAVVGQIAANKIGISYSKLLDLSNLKASPIDKDGNITPEVQKICDFTNKLPFDLFSVDQLIPLETNKAEIEMTADEVQTLMLTSSSNVNPEALMIEEDGKAVLNALLDELTPKERKVLQLRYGMDCEEKTYDEIGELFDVSRSRIQQIEHKALRKMRNPFRKYALRMSSPSLLMPSEKEDEE